MKTTTLCFLIKEGEVLLAMKKRGFGEGKWNGVGGKLLEGESIEAAALREIKEEVGVTVASADLEPMGSIKFMFEGNPGWDNQTHVFCIKKWAGVARESEEMRPRWYKKNELPLDHMWIDDPHWLPLVLANKKIEGEFAFDATGDQLVTFKVREV